MTRNPDSAAVRSYPALWAPAPDVVRPIRRQIDLLTTQKFCPPFDRRDDLRPGYEERLLLEFAEQAINKTDLSRISFYGFRKKDIVEYVRPESLSLVQEWRELRSEYGNYLLDKKDFKHWLKLRKRAQIDTQRIRRAATDVPTDSRSDFTGLLNLVS